MYLFYIIALIPVVIGMLLFFYDKNITLIEWIVGSIVAFVVAGTFHFLVIRGMTSDVETWSGYITNARQYSAWLEYYEYAVYRTEYYTTTEYYTDSKGHSHSHQVQHSRQVFDHWQPSTRHHDEYWKAWSNINTDYGISKDKYVYFTKKFNHEEKTAGVRSTIDHNSRMISGDPYDYVSHNKTQWIEPITTIKSWENRVKAAPSVFSFISVPTNIPVFNYPENKNPWTSDRLLGKATKDINLFEFDAMNARLGSKKKVNVIMIGFDSYDSMLGEYQKAKWIGGKKNDVVLVYGKDWVRVFGWTDKEIVKENLQTILLKNKIDTAILPLIEEEIIKNYIIKDWKQFDYLKIEPRPIHFLWFILITAAIQTGLYIWFNYIGKED